MISVGQSKDKWISDGVSCALQITHSQQGKNIVLPEYGSCMPTVFSEYRRLMRCGRPIRGPVLGIVLRRTISTTQPEVKIEKIATG